MNPRVDELENSAFKYMFSDRVSNDSPDVIRLSHDNQSFLKD